MTEYVVFLCFKGETHIKNGTIGQKQTETSMAGIEGNQLEGTIVPQLHANAEAVSSVIGLPNTIPSTEPKEKTMNMQTKIQPVQNGVNTEALMAARAALTETPAAGQFTWRAECDWVNGTHSRSTVKGFFGLGGEQSHTKVFTMEADHPPQFAAADNGATPVEIVLSALASCLTAGVAAVAQHRGIQLRGVKAKVEGDMDIAGILGIDPDVRNGFSAIRVSFDVDADATKDEIAALVAQSQKRSAVFDIITNPGNVNVSVA